MQIIAYIVYMYADIPSNEQFSNPESTIPYCCPYCYKEMKPVYRLQSIIWLCPDCDEEIEENQTDAYSYIMRGLE